MIRRTTSLILCALLIFQFVPPPKPLQAVIALTASQTQATQDNTDPVTMDFDCNGGNLLVVGVSTRSTAREGGNVTYNAVAMTASPEGIVSGGTESSTEIWYMVSPPGGSNEISIPFSNTNTTAGAVPIATAWSGVDTGDPLDTSESNSGVDGNPTVTLTTGAAGKLIINQMTTGEGEVMIANSHTLISSQDNGAWDSNGQYTMDDGSAGITLDWTIDGTDDWGSVVASFNPEGAEPPARRIFIID